MAGPMRKLPSLLLLAAAALGLAGCDVHLGPYAAVADGVTISQGTLDDAMSSAAADTGYLCSVTGNFQSAIATHGVGTGTYDTHFADFVLGSLIRSQLAADEVSRKGLTVSPLVESIATSQLTSSMGTAVGCSGTGASILAALSPAYRTSLVSFYEDLDVLGAAQDGVTLTAAGLSSYAASHPQATELTCANFIQVATLASAQKAETALAKGANFADEALKVSVASTDTVPCTPTSQFPAAVADALAPLAVGAISAPIAFQGSYLILQVSGREAASQDQVAQIVVTAAQAHFGSIVTTIDEMPAVQVDPAYGSWARAPSTESAITPPAGPPDRFVPSPGAVTPPNIVGSTTTTTLPGSSAG
jgi:parvulin-like peptidyl-prolyl isomerase